MCVYAPEAITIGTFYDISAAFQLHFMAFAIDRHVPSNEMRRQLQPKKTKGKLYYPFIRMFISKRCLPTIHY